jgi:hypothetical protein
MCGFFATWVPLHPFQHVRPLHRIEKLVFVFKRMDTGSHYATTVRLIGMLLALVDYENSMAACSCRREHIARRLLPQAEVPVF